MLTYRIRSSDAGLTCLQYLRLILPAAPQSYLKQLLRKGKVRADGKPVSPDTPLEAESILTLPQSNRLQELAAAAVPMLVDILHEEDLLLVVDKPSGLAVHRSKGHEDDNLLERVRRRSKALGQEFQIAPVHRLDAETSGPVLFGKGHQAISSLGKMFMAGGIEKSYLALVRGDLPDKGRLETPVPAKGTWKDAATSFHVRRRLGAYLLVELLLESGRTHQIRRQMADRGLPLVGDRRYGGLAVCGFQRLFLHCNRLSFRNPFSGEQIAVESALPPPLSELLDTLG
ncbi:MAG: RluA family pseudouridine synthase [Desulfuromonadales bacterium]|nr:RluA family pseudouridine synthase [Desulfuromonadales bacterium]NIS41725.1 RluA family pseudouridine synthase [Desulfuromonadales bacterium]